MKIPFGFGCLLADEIFKDTHTQTAERKQKPSFVVALVFIAKGECARVTGLQSKEKC